MGDVPQAPLPVETTSLGAGTDAINPTSQTTGDKAGPSTSLANGTKVGSNSSAQHDEGIVNAPERDKKGMENGESVGALPALEDANVDDLLKEFLLEIRQVDRDNEVDRILNAFKLNPFEQMGLKFDANLEAVRRQFRKLSLMVHPDKCTHPRAREAFEILGEAQKFLLEDEKREQLNFALGVARDEIRAERRKTTKHDAAVRVAIALHEEGRAGVEAEYEKSEEFHEKWRLKSRDVLARTEWRRRNLAKRIRDEEDRIEKEEKSQREQAKRVREHKDSWEKTRDTRVGTWRDYLKQQKGGKKKKKGGMELRPPKIKTNDEEKLYVQRPVGEQFRPPQQKR